MCKPVPVPAVDLITTKEAAELRGVSVWTVARWVKDGKLHAAHRLANGHYLFERRVVLEFDPRSSDTEDGAA